MKILYRYIVPSLIDNNVTDWRQLIQHPNTGKSNNSEEKDTNNDIVTELSVSPKIQVGDQLIPLYCTILGLVILCLIAYVIYKLWKQKSNSLPCSVIVSKGSSGNSFRLPKHSPSNKSDCKEMTSLVKSTEGVKWSNVEQFLLNQSIYCLPEDQVEAIIFSLSDESSGVGWIHLAQHHNFKQEDIDFISQSNDNSEAIRYFLKKWSENPSNNLKKLIKSLQDISRPDTAFLIKSSLRKFNPKDNPNFEVSKNETNNNSLLVESQTNGTSVMHT